LKSNRKYTIAIGIACLIKICLHLLADLHSGFQGDELLHIDAGNHLASGYMEFPPFIGMVAFIQNLTGSTSVFVHHLFSHIASLTIIILAGKITLELGGKINSLVLVLITLLAAPAFTRTHELFQPVVFSQLFWLLDFLYLVKFVKTSDKKYLLLLTLVSAIGILTKYDIAFFIFGMSSLFMYKRTRSIVLNRSLVLYFFLFLSVISMNVIWQLKNGLPLFQHMSELYKTQLNEQSVGKVLLDLFIQLNPFAVSIYLAGILYVTVLKKDEQNRIISISIIISVFLLAVARGKPYYFFPVFICLTIFGSIWLDNKLLKKRRWLFYSQIILLVMSGAVMIPHGMPVLSLDRYLQFAGIEKEDGRYPLSFEEFYSQYQWKKVLTSVHKTVNSLPPNERADCLIWGKHYKQAGLINLFSEEYNLPEAISYHGSYYAWAPETGDLPGTVISISNKGVPEEFWSDFFNTVEVSDKVRNIYADEPEDEWIFIYVCKSPKIDFAGLKETFKDRIFE